MYILKIFIFISLLGIHVKNLIFKSLLPYWQFIVKVLKRTDNVCSFKYGQHLSNLRLKFFFLLSATLWVEYQSRKVIFPSLGIKYSSSHWILLLPVLHFCYWMQVHVPDTQWGQTNQNMWNRERFIAGSCKEMREGIMPPKSQTSQKVSAKYF